MEPIQDSFGETPVHPAIACDMREKDVSNFLQFSRREAMLWTMMDVAAPTIMYFKR